ncbi:hypothetical protein DJ66_0085 [Candidatus Liberibacter solanacearum]|uniref:Uncharacterized protein n=1 Tax=Candidatus Liberibacter solanacearum TaxID=556287 RepID=A0A0F4VLT9_9HYPH|nr:hypothetical protein DJ66_0085 [Candidatus Liberibacter solanacearum]
MEYIAIILKTIIILSINIVPIIGILSLLNGCDSHKSKHHAKAIKAIESPSQRSDVDQEKTL